MSVSRSESDVEITVHDTGIGISAEQLPYMFQRFWQAHTGASREFGGSGHRAGAGAPPGGTARGTIAAESAGPGLGPCLRALPLAARRG